MTEDRAFVLPQGGKGSFSEAVRSLCAGLLEGGVVDAILVPSLLPRGVMVQHVLVRDPKATERMLPLAPVLSVNAGPLVARLTRDDPGGRLAAILRPCEIRAFVELVKLNQGKRERVLILGVDCPGTVEPREYERWALENPSYKDPALEEALVKEGRLPDPAPTMRSSCLGCEYPTPSGVDIEIPIWGMDGSAWVALAKTGEGESALFTLGLEVTQGPPKRQEAVGGIVEQRRAFKRELLDKTEKELIPLEQLLGELSRCINCHNCRNACPVCYCKTCVMDSSTMEHPSSQYLRWARRRGAVRMPGDTLFFHLTRLAHMSTSCVGCGQCSSACPMGIRVADIFQAVGRRTQALFQYVPGRNLEEPIPLATFREQELEPR